jgi:hypothetical protein
MNPYLLEMEIKERRRAMLELAKHRRLVGLYNADTRSHTDKLVLALAEWLIRSGEKLRRRHGQPLDLDRELCRE